MEVVKRILTFAMDNCVFPFFQKAYKSVKSKYEKYNDIHNGGEATEREENLLMKYSEQLERPESILSSIDEILK